MPISDTESLASSVADSANLEHHHEEPQTYQKPESTPDNIDTASTTEPENVEKVSRQPSSTSTTRKKCPINERRGLLSRLCLLSEYYDAREYSAKKKYIIVAIVGAAAITGPMGTSIMLPAIDDLSHNLDTNVGTVNVSVGIYLISLGVFPVWWSNFSEIYGRRSVYVISYAIFLAFSIGCAFAPTITALIVLRLFAGLGASAIQACGAGTISDLYVQEERGTAFGIFYLGPLLGPFLSPIIGGAVAEAWGWRATMWVMVIMCGCNLISIITLLPETLLRHHDMIAEQIEEVAKESDTTQPDLERIITNVSANSSLRRQVVHDPHPADIIAPSLSRVTTHNSAYSRRIKEQGLQDAASETTETKKTWTTYLYDGFVRPLHSLVFLGYPPVLLTILFSAMTFFGIYLTNISISNSYSADPYNFSPIIVGLMYIPNSVTYVVASILGGRWNDWLIKRHARLYDGELKPESRISWNMVLAISLYPPAALIFGWCLDKHQMWVTPLIGTALFGFASMMIIGTTTTYIIDVMPGKGATGVALNNLVRQVLAAIATFITEPLISAIGIGALFSIYMAFILLFSLFFFYVKFKGKAMRERYDLTDYYAKL